MGRITTETLFKPVRYISPFALLVMIILSRKYSCVGAYSQYYMLFGVAFFASVTFTSMARLIAFKFNVLDHPDPRKIHAKPIPLLGGVAVFMAFLCTHLVYMRVEPKMIGIFIAASLIMVVGAIDDKRGLSDKFRFVAQIVAALIAIKFDLVLHFGMHHWWGQPVSIALSVFWIIGITNAVNFMDGMDGLCAGLGAIAAMIFFLIAYQLNDPYLAIISIAFSAACAGFLVHNFRPARIFLGDAGSTTIGFVLACLGLMGNWASGKPFVSFSVPILILGVPIFDMIYTTVERIWSGKVRTVGEWMRYTGKDHFHHRLIDHGFGQTQTVLFIYFVSLTLGLNAVVITRSNIQMVQVLLLLLQSACVFLIISILMIIYRGGYTDPAYVKTAGAETPETDPHDSAG